MDDGAALPTIGAPVGQLPPNVPPYSKLGVIVPVAAAVEAHAAAVVEGVGAGGDVDQADRAQAEFGRQRAGDERHAADQAGFQNAAEAGHAVGQHNAIDAELHIGVIVAHMDEAAGGGIPRVPGACNSTFSTVLALPCGSASMVS